MKYNKRDIDLYSTGNHEGFDEYKIIIYNFGKYQIEIKLTHDNRFVSIESVKINKLFTSIDKPSRASSIIDKFYIEDDE